MSRMDGARERQVSYIHETLATVRIAVLWVIVY
jgi:hypothetical protein